MGAADSQSPAGQGLPGDGRRPAQPPLQRSEETSNRDRPPIGGRFAPGGLFDAATRFDALWDAWEKVRANAGAAGGDGVTIAAFAATAHGRLSQLSHRLREGRYAPGAVRRVYVPKPKGGVRPLDIPSVADRVAQAAVAAQLTPVLEPHFHDASFAYRPGRSVAMAVRRVASLRRDGYRHVVDGDIRRYFEMIPHPRLISRLEQHVDDGALIDLIGLWLEQHSHEERGVPQGSPLSPLLANLYLDAVDDAIQSAGVRLVRYADDFLVLCRSEALAGDAMARIGALLAAQGLELNLEKSRLVDFDQGFRFLGHLFVRGMVWRELAGEDDTPAEDAIAAAEAMTRQEAELARDADAQSRPAPVDPSAEAPPRGRYALRQRVLYLLQPGRRLTAEHDSFVVRDTGAKEMASGQIAADDMGAVVVRAPHRRIDRIEVYTGADIDAAALDLAAASDTMVVRVNGFGVAQGRWLPPGPARATRALAQAAMVLDPARRLAQARLIVGARIRNQRVQLKRMSRTRPEAELAVVTNRLKRLLRAAELKPGLDIAALMGFEGEAAALYWPAAASLVGAPALFSGRRESQTRSDPMNAALDLLSGLLARDINVSVDRAGLHPGFGILHATQDLGDALVYDLMEAFRAPIVEACLFAAIGRGAFTAEHATRFGDGWRLSREGMRVLIRQYEAWVQRPILSPHSGEKGLWRALFEDEAMALARAVETSSTFQPYLMDY
jgi:CRISPR-associated protein Cas1